MVLTHCHFDHSGGAHQFPGSQVWAHEAEAGYIRSSVSHQQFDDERSHEISREDSVEMGH